MPTEKQKQAVNNLVENRGNVSKAMRDAGYKNKTAKNPRNLTESKGFEEICKKYGLTNSLIVKSLVDDIKAKPENRIAELNLASKIKGLQQDKIDITSKGEKLNTVLVEFINEKPKDNPNTD